jgi:hypothetical protein
MPKMANRVQETTTTGGTGVITLAGAVTGYITFAAGFTTGDVLFYVIDNGIGEWEIGIGTLVTTGTLSRTTVIASSNSGALVNFSSGTKRVFCSAPTRSLVPDQDSKSGYVLTTDGTNPSWTQTLNSVTIGNTAPASGAFTTLSASSTVSGAGFSTFLASPPAIGGTTPAAGNFTTLGATGNTTLGDASTDTLTINGTAVSTPNNLNFDSNTLFIDAANNRVGINTASPGTRLHVVSASNPAAIFESTSAASAGIEIRDGAATPNRWWLLSGLTSTTDGIFSIYDARQSLARLAINTAGNVGIGVTPNTGNSACLQLSSGITFPATQVASTNANTLDDYEEGTWTPSVGGTATYTVQDGYYVKIGKVVYVSARFLINVIGTGSTSTISGLPFVSANTFARGEFSVGRATALATALFSLTLEVPNNSSTIIFQGRTAAGNQTDIAAAMGNSTDLYFSGFYFVG